MKKALFLLLLFPALVYSETCHWIKNSPDAFNENKNFQTKEYNINEIPGNPYYFSCFVSYTEFEDNMYENLLHIKLTATSKNLFSNSGERLLLKLNNGYIVDFSPEFTSGTSFNVFDGTASTGIVYSYIITEELLHKIQTVGISDIRLHTFDSYYDASLNQTDNQSISALIECYLSNLPK